MGSDALDQCGGQINILPPMLCHWRLLVRRGRQSGARGGRWVASLSLVENELMRNGPSL